MRFFLVPAVVLSFALAPARAGSDPKVDSAAAMSAFLKSLPDARVSPFTEAQAVALAAMPLACVDHPQAKPRNTTYLWVTDSKPHLLEDYDKNRAFYGCFDWHSAVNSTWTMVTVLRKFPQIPVGKLIREKLYDHLGKKNIEGEMEFFKDKDAKTFEQPYGRSWVLKLAADLQTWDDPDAKKWSADLAPLVKQFDAGLLDYMKNLPYVTRNGIHPNTAFSMSLLLDYAAVARDDAMRQAIADTAKRVFLADVDCPTAYEPAGSDFLSPCLEEAKLMSRVLPQTEFVSWFDRFMPPVYSTQFKPLTKPFDTSGITKEEQLAGKSHLIGLGFARGEAMLAIANALPPNDPRVAAYRRLAAINGEQAFRNLEGAGYFGSHWLGTYAVRYELAAGASQ